MKVNRPYDPMSLLAFQASILSLGAALDDSELVGSRQESNTALGEAEHLKERLDRDWR